MWPLILAAAGLVKGETVDKDKERNQAQLQATTTKYSPWTGMSAAPPTRADPVGNAIAGAAAGAAMDQSNTANQDSHSLKAAQIYSLLNPANQQQTNWGNGGATNSPWSSMNAMSASNPANNGGYSLFN